MLFTSISFAVYSIYLTKYIYCFTLSIALLVHQQKCSVPKMARMVLLTVDFSNVAKDVEDSSSVLPPDDDILQNEVFI
jgi:hypothetical protein